MHPTAAISTFEKFLRRSINNYLDELPGDTEHPFLRQIPKNYGLRIWATVMGKEGFINPHIHSESWITGAYYVCFPGPEKSEEAENAGWIKFGPPDRVSQQKYTATTKLIKPEPGLLLLFPSYFHHQSLPLKYFSNRISLAFEIYAIAWR